MAGDIASQGRKGSEWDYELTPVYGIYITNFVQPLFDDEQMVEKVSLMNERTHKRFSDKLRMYFLKVPYMTKTAEECTEPLEGWMYMFKNMEKMKKMPEVFMKDPVFRQLEDRARVGALNDSERRAYDHSLKVYRDNLAIISYERSEGIAEGIEKGLRQAAENMAAAGLGKDVIFKATGIRMD